MNKVVMLVVRMVTTKGGANNDGGAHVGDEDNLEDMIRASCRRRTFQEAIDLLSVSALLARLGGPPCH